MRGRRPVIGVMGAGDNAAPADVENARRLGELIAREGWILLTGGRDAGVMKAANEGAKRIEGSLTIGLLPFRTTTIAPDVDVAIITDMGEARNNINVLSSDVVVACGVGGAGTVSEVALAIKAGRPVIVIGAGQAANDFYRSLGGDLIHIVESPEEAVEIARRL